METYDNQGIRVPAGIEIVKIAKKEPKEVDWLNIVLFTCLVIVVIVLFFWKS